MSEEKDKNINVAIWCVVIVVLLLAASFIIWIFTNRTESRVVSEIDDAETEALLCNSNNNEGAFFDSQYAESEDYQIKVVFKNQKINEVFSIYDSKYESATLAENAQASLHAKYNKYMNEMTLAPESLSPNYSLVENELKISLYSEWNKISQNVLKLFFLNPDEFNKTTNYSPDDLKTIYENAGFSCEIDK